MKNIILPAPGSTVFSEERVNRHSRVFVFSNAETEMFDFYCKYISDNGFSEFESYTIGSHRYAAYVSGDTGIFLNYFEGTHELYLAEEEECLYFSYTDTKGEASVTTELTQVELEDFGMSYAIRMNDGRYIVIDGGRFFEPDADRLYNCIKKGSPYEKPIIAAWIMSHPHSDHYQCIIPFMDKYGHNVTVQKFIFNFPEHDDFAHYPWLESKDPRFEDSSPFTNLPLMYERIRSSGAPIYMAHTGQKYSFGDVNLEVLASIEDTIRLSPNGNAASLVLRFEIEGQIILFMTDAAFSIAQLPEKYSDYLKSDIMQVPHHGFSCGDEESTIRGYDLVRPKVCFLPVSDFNAYNVFSAFKDSTAYLMTKAGIEEMIVGTPQRTITLPYTAPHYAKSELERKYTEGQKSAGAKVWFFTDLSTDNPDDFVFTVLNSAHKHASVMIELFFEENERNIRYIKADIAPLTMKKFNITGEDVDADALFFNWMSLKLRGIPEKADFAVRFISNTPVIVSHKNHKATYYC